jgi:adsorption protein B
MRMDHWVANLLFPLAVWVLFNGIDDLIVDFAAIAGYIRQTFSSNPDRRIPSEAQLDTVPPRSMAVFIALWKESHVIQKILDNNVGRLRYPHCDFFVGVYPNDTLTIAAVCEAIKRSPNIHIAVCPHDGPTSKADCLNWIYQRMLLHEEEHGVRFDMILTHDAEDTIDPDALRWINYYAQWNDMVQIPVLALKTPLGNLVHGVYCDEFAEYQFKDMVGRAFLGGFIPSNGVGTGFSRHALEMLSARFANRIFEPGCLTEDYLNGFRIHSLGMSQRFIPIQIRHGRPIATREYFPITLGRAVTQRTRWMIGITLQSWEFQSVRGNLRYLYWFWRDRKSIVGNLVTPLTNLVFLYGAVTLAWAHALHRDWGLARESSYVESFLVAGLALQTVHTAIRSFCSARIYGWLFACCVPIRVIFGNWMNCAATSLAIWTYTNARLHHRPLRWAKTEHAYPSRATLLNEPRRLSDILTGSLWITPEQIAAALLTKPPDRRLGEHLVALGLIPEQDLYAALSLQNNLPLGKPDVASVSVPVTRALPAAVARKWRIFPFRIAAGEIYVAGSDLPDDEMQKDIRRFSSLELRFHLITPTEFEELAAQYL